MRFSISYAGSIALLTSIALLLLISSCQPPTQNRKNGTNGEMADQLPALLLLKPDGSTLDLQSLKGKKIMVNLWATWCGPCRTEMPSIAALYASVDTAKTALVLLSLDEKKEKSIAFLQAHSLQNYLYFPGADLPDLFNVLGIPATFFFDENGKLTEQIMGGTDYDSDRFRTILN